MPQKEIVTNMDNITFRKAMNNNEKHGFGIASVFFDWYMGIHFENNYHASENPNLTKNISNGKPCGITYGLYERRIQTRYKSSGYKSRPGARGETQDNTGSRG